MDQSREEQRFTLFGTSAGEAAMADDPPLERAVEDPPQPLLSVERRLQLRHFELELQALAALLVAVHEEVHQLHLAPPPS
jgi:hypothetical protein